MWRLSINPTGIAFKFALKKQEYIVQISFRSTYRRETSVTARVSTVVLPKFSEREMFILTTTIPVAFRTNSSDFWSIGTPGPIEFMKDVD